MHLHFYILSFFLKLESQVFTVSPEPPPGISEAIMKLLSWLAWIGWVSVAAALIAGGISLVLGYMERGKRLIFGAILGALILAFYSAIISGLIG
ncbi:MAG: hypothetical protein QW765_05245 [Fervidicoccaceae archaeon]